MKNVEKEITVLSFFVFLVLLFVGIGILIKSTFWSDFNLTAWILGILIGCFIVTIHLYYSYPN